MAAVIDKQQEDSDILEIRELIRNREALRRYFSHHLRNDAMTLITAVHFRDWNMVEDYVANLKKLLNEVGL